MKKDVIKVNKKDARKITESIRSLQEISKKYKLKIGEITWNRN
jgi:hypothetical protein